MKFVPAGLTRNLSRVVLKTQKNSPTILFAAGVVGVVGTTVLASRATLQLSDVLEDAQKDQADAGRLHAQNRSDYTDEVYNKDMLYIQIRTAQKICKLYAPAVVLGAVSIGCLVQSHRILKARNGALMAAYVALDKTFSEYRERVGEELGETREKEIYRNVQKVELVDDKGKKTTVSERGTTSNEYVKLWSRDTSKRWVPEPDYNRIFLDAQQQFATDRLRARGYLFLNDVFDAIGLPRTKAGQIVGWVYNVGSGDDYVDFGLGDWPSTIDYANGSENELWLEFNVDGPVLDLFDKVER